VVMCRSVMARGGREMVFGGGMLCSSHGRSLWFRETFSSHCWSFPPSFGVRWQGY
jgi:hypothetical protein